jgi:hypothetical protein
MDRHFGPSEPSWRPFAISLRMFMIHPQNSGSVPLEVPPFLRYPRKIPGFSGNWIQLTWKRRWISPFWASELRKSHRGSSKRQVSQHPLLREIGAEEASPRNFWAYIWANYNDLTSRPSPVMMISRGNYPKIAILDKWIVIICPDICHFIGIYWEYTGYNDV